MRRITRFTQVVMTLTHDDIQCLVVVVKVVFVAITTLVVEETSVVMVALVAVKMVVDLVAVKTVPVDWVTIIVMGEAAPIPLEKAEAMGVVDRLWKPWQWTWWVTTLEVVRATMLLALQQSLFKFWTHEGRKLYVGTLTHAVVANIFARPQNQGGIAALASVGTLAVAESFNGCQETKLGRKGESKRQEHYRLHQICEHSQAQWWQGPAATLRTCFT